MKPFVFVLGAGASVDLKLPMGAQLTGQIKKALNFSADPFGMTGGDDLLRAALSSCDRTHPAWRNAARSIASAMPLAPSIDNFVDVHRNDEDVAFCAKAAITRCILQAERASTIYVNPDNIYNTINFEGNVKAWHTLFFRILTTNCVFEDLPDRLRKIGVISFNYDRCFEHFLFHAIKAYYRVSDRATAETLEHLEIYHPYGKVGELPYVGRGATVEYGAEVRPAQLLEISNQIRTFTETVDEEAGDIKRIREIAYDALQLVFLGFAFHALNVRLLFPNVRSGSQVGYNKRIIATAVGSSDSDLSIISDDLRVRYNCDRKAVELRKGLTCDQLFSEYSRTLTMV